jgi:hypothetical protein
MHILQKFMQILHIEVDLDNSVDKYYPMLLLWFEGHADKQVFEVVKTNPTKH